MNDKKQRVFHNIYSQDKTPHSFPFATVKVTGMLFFLNIKALFSLCSFSVLQGKKKFHIRIEYIYSFFMGFY